MQQSILTKLEGLCERLQEVDALLGTASIISDQARFVSLSKERAELEPVVVCYTEYQSLQMSMASVRELLRDDDPRFAPSPTRRSGRLRES